MTGLSQAKASAVLGAIFKQVAYSEAAVWAQLHTGDPGPAGTANVANNSTRKDVTTAFDNAPALVGSNMVLTSTDDVAFNDATAAEDYTFVSYWTLAAGGAFIASGTVVGNSVGIGDAVVCKAGSMTVALPVAA